MFKDFFNELNGGEKNDQIESFTELRDKVKEVNGDEILAIFL